MKVSFLSWTRCLGLVTYSDPASQVHSIKKKHIQGSLALQNRKNQSQNCFWFLRLIAFCIVQRVCYMFSSVPCIMKLDLVLLRALMGWQMVCMFQFSSQGTSIQISFILEKQSFRNTRQMGFIYYKSNCILMTCSLCNLTHSSLLILCLGLQGVEHCGLFLVYLHESIFPTVPILMLLSVYCDKIGTVLLRSIHVW